MMMLQHEMLPPQKIQEVGMIPYVVITHIVLLDETTLNMKRLKLVFLLFLALFNLMLDKKRGTCIEIYVLKEPSHLDGLEYITLILKRNFKIRLNFLYLNIFP